MAVCALCNAEETQLYVNGVPVCLKCEEKKMQGAPPSIPPVNQEPAVLDMCCSWMYGQLLNEQGQPLRPSTR